MNGGVYSRLCRWAGRQKDAAVRPEHHRRRRKAPPPAGGIKDRSHHPDYPECQINHLNICEAAAHQETPPRSNRVRACVCVCGLFLMSCDEETGKFTCGCGLWVGYVGGVCEQVSIRYLSGDGPEPFLQAVQGHLQADGCEQTAHISCCSGEAQLSTTLMLTMEKLAVSSHNHLHKMF